MKSYLQFTQIIGLCLILFSGVIYDSIGNFTYLLVGLGIYLIFKTEKLKQDIEDK
mgnify:CR=1 FL=1|jgi:hypothetical protein